MASQAILDHIFKTPPGVPKKMGARVPPKMKPAELPAITPKRIQKIAAPSSAASLSKKLLGR